MNEIISFESNEKFREIVFYYTYEEICNFVDKYNIKNDTTYLYFINNEKSNSFRFPFGDESYISFEKVGKFYETRLRIKKYNNSFEDVKNLFNNNEIINNLFKEKDFDFEFIKDKDRYFYYFVTEEYKEYKVIYVLIEKKNNNGEKFISVLETNEFIVDNFHQQLNYFFATKDREEAFHFMQEKCQSYICDYDPDFFM